MIQSEKLKGQTERTDKELLELVLEDLWYKMATWDCCGICAVISQMEILYFIDDSEECRLYHIIDENPTEYKRNSLFYFPPREVEPRIEYLKKLIEKYS